MRGPRPLVALTSGLLLTAAGLHVLAAWQRWGGSCSLGGDESAECMRRSDHLYDAVLPSDPWQPIGTIAELLGLAMLMIAVALALVPAALGRRTTGFTRPVLGLAVLIEASVGAITLVAGIAGRPVVELPTAAPVFLVYFLALPILIGMALLIPDGDDRPAGLRGGLVGWMLICTTPLIQFMVGVNVAGDFVDTFPWYEAMVVPFLVVAAVAILARGRRQRSFSNQHLAHSLSL